MARPYPSQTMMMEVEYILGDDVELKILETFGAVLEWVGNGIRERRIKPIKTLELFLDQNYLNYMITAKWEYLDG